jgi:hypothetical protein
MQALSLVAEHEGPTMFAGIGVMRALNRHVERVFNPSRKEKHWGRQQAGAGSVSLLYILALLPRRDPRATSMIKLAFAAFLLFNRYPVRNKSSG